MDSGTSVILKRLCAASMVMIMAQLSGFGTTALANEKTESQSEAMVKDKTAEDPFLWLEDVDGEQALQWATEQNAVSLQRLQSDERYEPARSAIESILTASDRIPYGHIVGDDVRNFWQDDTHIRGLWRTTSLQDYHTDSPTWDTILDIDALAATDGENWVWKGANCLAPDEQRCLISLSRGGADAVVVREFDIKNRRFIEDGFALDEEKHTLDWIDADTLLIASPLEGGAKNTSGYARTIRIWKRGTALADAKTVFTGPETDAFAFPAVMHRPEGVERFIIQAPDFFHQTVHYLDADDSLITLPLPDDVNLQGIMDGRLILLLRNDWQAGETKAKSGSVVSVPLSTLLDGTIANVQTIVEPTDTLSIENVRIGRDSVYVALLDMVKGRLIRANYQETGWTYEDVALPEQGSLNIISASAYSNRLMVNFETFLQPDTLYVLDDATSPEAIKTAPARFDASNFVSEQKFATSDDGTRIPYFLIHARDVPMDGTTPTILYGYGGFEISLTPGYLSPMAIEWLKHGGAYAIANIRGGGEFGPGWHNAALKENRPRAYEDFAAVARAIAASGLANADHLGIYGGSNGGLLTGASMVRTPDLFGAVVSAVPLLDMMRYHKLLAGASWIGEYGNPDIPEERDWIAAYSPYQKVARDVTYPPAFFTTSTRDDRVHPGHARKMSAKMLDQGHEVLYYENMEGGHAGAANLKQRAMRDALIIVWFLQELADQDK